MRSTAATQLGPVICGVETPGYLAAIVRGQRPNLQLTCSTTLSKTPETRR